MQPLLLQRQSVLLARRGVIASFPDLQHQQTYAVPGTFASLDQATQPHHQVRMDGRVFLASRVQQEALLQALALLVDIAQTQLKAILELTA